MDSVALVLDALKAAAAAGDLEAAEFLRMFEGWAMKQTVEGRECERSGRAFRWIH